MAEILYPKVDRVTHQGCTVEMSSLDQRGLAIVRKWPNGETYVGSRDANKTTVKDATPPKTNEQPKVGNDTAGKPTRAKRSSNKSNVVTHVTE